MFISYKTIRINLDKVRRFYQAGRRLIFEYSEDVAEDVDFNTEEEARNALSHIDTYIEGNQGIIIKL